MTVPVGQGLFGECREAERCICGLCAGITYGHQSEGRPRKPDNEMAAIERDIRRKARQLRAALKPKVPKPRLLMGEPAIPDPCGCLIWKQRRIRWCDTLHNPQTHPNPCQHHNTSVQNFGQSTQTKHCLDCSNDISD